jgi:hypothetical protein
VFTVDRHLGGPARAWVTDSLDRLPALGRRRVAERPPRTRGAHHGACIRFTPR